jgi:crotonobetainyl-CoA:carnitine CoA-transferase CaiB-like acyl-CoA transferase
MGVASIISYESETPTRAAMTLLWFVTGTSLLVALVAWLHARRTARRLEQLSQMYWELKYQHGELRVQVQRLTPGSPTPPGPPAPAERPSGAFVPLASLKR